MSLQKYQYVTYAQVDYLLEPIQVIARVTVIITVSTNDGIP